MRPGRSRNDETGPVIATLKKRDVEHLLADYDTDPIGALTDALRIALDMPGSDWESLVASAPIVDARRQLLLSADERSLDLLAAELNEFRDFM